MGLLDGLFGGGGDMPEAPDPYQVAKSTYQFGNLDTYAPSGGGVRYGYTDANGRFVQGAPPKGRQAAVQTIESDFDRASRGIMEPASLDLARMLVQGNLNRMPARPGMPTLDTRRQGVRLDTRAIPVRDRSDVARALFGKGMSLARPQIEQGTDRLLTNLQARGMPVGAEGFNEAIGAHTREVNEGINRLAMDATLQAGQEQSREFELARSGRAFGNDAKLRQFDVKRTARGDVNQARTQAFDLGRTSRADALSEILSIFTGQFRQPNATPQGGSTGVDMSSLIGDQYKSRLAEWQQQRADRQATMSTLGNIAGSFIMACSPEWKDIIAPARAADALAALARLTVSFFTYKDEAPVPVVPGLDRQATHIGPMADEFQRVTGMGDGKTIPMQDAIGLLIASQQGALERMEDLENRLFRELERRMPVPEPEKEAA